MVVSQSDLDNFHKFATQAIAQHGQSLSFEDLVAQPHAKQEREEAIASVRRGVGDANAGRLRDATEVDATEVDATEVDATEVDATIRAKPGFPARRR